MSDAQLDKVKMELKNLQEELKSLQNSMSVEEAAGQLMSYVNGKHDPLLNPSKPLLSFLPTAFLLFATMPAFCSHTHKLTRLNLWSESTPIFYDFIKSARLLR